MHHEAMRAVSQKDPRSSDLRYLDLVADVASDRMLQRSGGTL